MVANCHRCSGVLEEEASFCPHCAAPQLRVAPPEESAEATTGPIHHFARDRRSMDWRKVIQLALLIAIPAGLLAPIFFPLAIAAPIVLISLYRRHRPGTVPLDGKTGFRIGALLGVLAAYVSAFGMAGWQLFEHYSLHRETALDTTLTTLLSLEVQQVTEATQRMAQTNGMNAQQVRSLIDFFLSPDARVAYTFLYTAIVAFGIVLLAGFGGMLGARLTRRSVQQQGN